MGRTRAGRTTPTTKGVRAQRHSTIRRGMGSRCCLARASMAARRSPSTGTPPRTRRDSRTALTTNQAAHSTAPAQ